MKPELTQEQRERLEVWLHGSHFPVFEVLDEGLDLGADVEELRKELLDLLELELSLEPISQDAWDLRKGQGLEPPDFEFMAQVDACIASIGKGELVHVDHAAINAALREQRLIVGDYRVAMEGWMIGWTRERTRGRDASDPAITNEVYDLLGDLDEEKQQLVAMMLGRIDFASRDLTRVEEIGRRLRENPTDSPTLEEKLHDQYYQMDLGTWHTIPNIRTLLGNIGKKDRAKEMHCWYGNPENIPGLETRVQAIEHWLADKPSGPDAQEIRETLGDKAAYKEKVWLTRCFLVPLRIYAADKRVRALTE